MASLIDVKVRGVRLRNYRSEWELLLEAEWHLKEASARTIKGSPSHAKVRAAIRSIQGAIRNAENQAARQGRAQ